MRYFITYLFLITSILAQAQEKAPCIEPGKTKGKASANICDEIKCLYKSGRAVEAYSLIQSLENNKCTDGSSQIVFAQTMAANNLYSQALTKLEGVFKDPKFSNEAQFEIDRIAKLKIMADQKSGTYIQNLIKTNTAFNDLSGFFLRDSLFSLNDKTDTINYFPRIESIPGRFHFSDPHVEQLNFGESFFGWENYADISTGFVLNDSLLFLSVLPHKAFNSKGNYEIICLDIVSKRRARNYNISGKGYNVMHPAIKDSTLYFSSDMEGGYGGMDLYKVAFDSEGYGEIVNLGGGINSAGNEVYPAITGDTLFFASDRKEGFGGFDIYKSSLNDPHAINLGTPVNTPYDDYGPTSADGKIKYFVSNRDGGQGGDDIYKVSFVEPTVFFQNLTGRIQTTDVDLSSVIIKITNADGTFSKTTTLDSDGSFTFSHIKGLESYEVSVVSDDLPKGSRLALFGEEGNVIKDVPMSADGMFKFELLTPLDYFLERIENEDLSVLSVDILGMIESDDLPEEGFKIYLEDSDGELIGMAVTDENGNFTFKSVKPDAQYVIRSKVTDPNATIHILGKDGEVISSIQPNNLEEFVYVRLSDANRVITLTNELEKKIKIADNELFSLPVLYFGLNEAELTGESKTSLKKLLILLDKNPGIALELSGHTDSRGSNAYNLKLSQQRIDAVVSFLSSHGVGRDRLVGKGYGESKLLNHCSDNVECSESEHALNRRTEIRIYQTSNPN